MNSIRKDCPPKTLTNPHASEKSARDYVFTRHQKLTCQLVANHYGLYHDDKKPQGRPSPQATKSEDEEEEEEEDRQQQATTPTSHAMSHEQQEARWGALTPKTYHPSYKFPLREWWLKQCTGGDKPILPKAEQIYGPNIKPFHNEDECKPCPAGTYIQGEIGNRHCIPCPKGYRCTDGVRYPCQGPIGRVSPHIRPQHQHQHQHHLGAAANEQSGSYWYQNKKRQDICEKCTRGFHVNKQNTECKPCEQGFYCPDAAHQIKCPPDRVCSSYETHGCKPGQYIQNSRCYQCTPGHKCNGYKQEACDAFTFPLYYSNKNNNNNNNNNNMVPTGASQCPTCADGEYVEHSTRRCTICPHNHYCLGGRKHGCTSGRWSPSGNSASSCRVYRPGYYVTAGIERPCPLGHACPGHNQKKACISFQQQFAPVEGLIECYHIEMGTHDKHSEWRYMIVAGRFTNQDLVNERGQKTSLFFQQQCLGCQGHGGSANCYLGNCAEMIRHPHMHWDGLFVPSFLNGNYMNDYQIRVCLYNMCLKSQHWHLQRGGRGDVWKPFTGVLFQNYGMRFENGRCADRRDNHPILSGWCNSKRRQQQQWSLIKWNRNWY